MKRRVETGAHADPEATAAAPASGPSTLLVRSLSSLVLGPAILGAAWWGGMPWTAVVLGGAILATREALHIVRADEPASNVLAGTLVTIGLVVTAGFPNVSQPLLLRLAVAYAVLLTFLVQIARPQAQRSLDDWSRTLAVSLYIGAMSGFLLGLRTLPDGKTWLLALLALIWTNDSFAYLGGRRFGRHAMAPALSPKKTWEGFAIAALATTVVAVLGMVLLDPKWLAIQHPYPAAVALALIVSTAGPLGDLSVSFLKRQTGVKDSGDLIPGHGGVLDRSDSLLFAAPLVYSLAVLLAAY